MFTGVEVAVDNAAFQFDKLYSYNVPAEYEPYAKVGARVLVPFGKSGSRMGIVLGLCEGSTDYKQILRIEQTEPVVNEEMVDLIKYLRNTTFCTYYDAVKAVLPKNIRLVPDGEDGELEFKNEGHTENAYRTVPDTEHPGATAKQNALLGYLSEPHTYSEIHEELGISRDVVNRLLDRGWIAQERRWRTDELDFSSPGYLDRFELSPAQQEAYDRIRGYMSDPDRPDTTLLYGVTSSGKTMLYVGLIRETLEAGKGAMLLVPEIALATQMIGRLQTMFPGKVGIIHSALSDTERTLQWKRILDGEYPLVVGTRSAVFAPIPEIGLIIIDEEQEQTYLADQSPRFRAPAVAAYRAKRHGAHLLLSSATPSVESYYLAQENKINYVELGERFGNMPLPDVRVVDMRNELMQGNTHTIGVELYEKIRERLDRKEQIILLLNRRGYRTVTICKECKEVIMCDSCSMPMVWHKTDCTHRCHYCGKIVPQYLTCPKCGGELRHTGIGTQKIEEELEELFPDARVLRVDLDSMSGKNSLTRSLRDFQEKKYDIIIGTQMIAKGLDFENVTLVGVLSVDSMLLMPSFRAYERTFDMLTQVIGRSGRGSKAGEAVIQTIDPDNPIIRIASRQDYRSFYNSEIRLRKAHLYPPYCHICAVCFSAESSDQGKTAANRFVEQIRETFSQEKNVPVRVIGPAPMRVPIVGKQYRWRLILKSRGDAKFRELLGKCLVEVRKRPGVGNTRIYIDFNDLDG
ncbi:MAG: primosomal protein N' [Oscillospiraceae bacterium]|nr:primosomal protein N' [Oscillospiraceae bacterium]